MLRETLLLALREVRRNALRSGLTTLGIAIGVAAVIAMLTLGDGATARVTADIASLGHNLLIAVPGSERGGALSAPAPFGVDDAEAIAREVPGLRAVAPVASRGVLAVNGSQNWSTTATGADDEYLQVREWALASGRSFLPGEVRAGRLVCILGDTPRAQLFGAQDPVGSQVRLGRLACPVIGVLEARGQASLGMDQDDVILMPLRAFHRRVAGDRDVGSIFVSAARAHETPRIKRDMEALLRLRRRLAEGLPDDFRVRDLREISDVVERTAGVLTAFLGAVAAVSLLVGGIGIMNIMLVSVTERTREIGIRLAVGALEGEVLLQFLVEAALLAALGGSFGVGLGLAGSALAAPLIGIPFVFEAGVAALAFVFSAAVGLVFGLLPARRAARLDPIDALRRE